MGQNLYVNLAIVLKTEDILKPNTKKRIDQINLLCEDSELETYGYDDDRGDNGEDGEGNESSWYEFLGVPITETVDLLRGDTSLLIDESTLLDSINLAKKKFKKLTGLEGEIRLVGNYSY